MASLTPSQTVLALAMINMAANFGGFVGNYVIAALKQATGNYYGAVWMMGAIMVLAACLVTAFPTSWALGASESDAAGSKDAGVQAEREGREQGAAANTSTCCSCAEKGQKQGPAEGVVAQQGQAA